MASGQILIIVHQKTSTSGNVGALLQARGYRLDQRCPCIGDPLPDHLDDHDGVVVFGGPMSANDDSHLDGIGQELKFIDQVLASDKPFIGICLGGQLLARALGAKVAPDGGGRVEIGYTEVSPTKEFEALFDASRYFFQWHKEGFDLPAGSRLMATGQVYPNQAFLHGARAVGLQFHPEINADMIQRWTRGGGHRTDQPNAQPVAAHSIGYRLFNDGIARWTEGLFDFVGLPARAASALAAG